VAESDNDSTLAHRKIEYEKANAQWERSDRVTLVIMNHSIDTGIRGKKFNYNGSDKNWTTTELIAKCSQEEEILRIQNKDYVNLISKDLKRNFSHCQSSGKSRGKFSQFKKGKGKKPYDKRFIDHPMKEAPKVEGASEKKKGSKCLHCMDWNT
jgi:hypothetical protein